MSIELTHTVVRKIAKGIRDKYGKEVPHTEVLSIISDAYGYDVGPFMHQLKNSRSEAPSEESQASSFFEQDAILKILPPILFDNVLSRVVNNAGGIYLFTGKADTNKFPTAKSFFKHLADGFGRNGVTAFLSGTTVDEETAARSSCNLWAFVRREATLRGLDSLIEARPQFVLCEDVHDSGTARHLLELAKGGAVVIAVMTSNEPVRDAWKPFVNALYGEQPEALSLVRADVHFSYKDGENKPEKRVEYWKIA